MKLQEIIVYPLKSCAGISLPEVALDRFGPSGDRRWMVVNPSGAFLTQREIPRMSQIQVTPAEGGLDLACKGSTRFVARPAADAPARRVRVWDDQVSAVDAGDEAGEWLAHQLERECRLVFMPDDSIRRVDGAYASAGETVGFADGFPLLLISRESLDDLNGRLPAAVPMNRFRPNLVISGCGPFAEDEWRRIRMGELEFDVAKACARCAVPSIVQETAGRDPHINRTLAGYRRFNGQIFFGQNLLYQKTGTLRVEDPVEVLA